MYTEIEEDYYDKKETIILLKPADVTHIISISHDVCKPVN